MSEAFGNRVVAEHLPLGEGETFRGYIDLAEQHAFVVERGKAREISLEPEMAGTVQEARTKLLEALGDFDDHLLEELLEGIEPPLDEIRRDLRDETVGDLIVPVLVGSALTDIGVSALLEVIELQFPAPAGDPSAPLVAQVCKTTIHPQSGKLSIVRVHTGTLAADAALIDRTRENLRIRAAGLYRLQGKKQEPLVSAGPGEVVAIARLEGVTTGATLTTNGHAVEPLSAPSVSAPLFAVAVRPKERLDDAKLSQVLARICEEDPAVAVGRAEFTNELQLLGAGEVHVATTAQRIARKYHLALDLSAPQIAYRETISQGTDSHARYKHQTGGHGQFADVTIRIEPRERGHGVTFSEQIVGGVVPRNFFPAVEKGVREALLHGPVAKRPVVDLHVTLIDGAYHTVDSSEAAFKTAAGLAIREGLARCGPILLEPILRVEADIPEEYGAAVLGGLSAKRAQVLAFEPCEPRGFRRVTALVPQAELVNYISELRTATAGLGTYRWQHDRFDVAPPKVAETLREAVAAG